MGALRRATCQHCCSTRRVLADSSAQCRSLGRALKAAATAGVNGSSERCVRHHACGAWPVEHSNAAGQPCATHPLLPPLRSPNATLIGWGQPHSLPQQEAANLQGPPCATACVRSGVGGAGPLCMHPPRCSIPPPLRTRAQGRPARLRVCHTPCRTQQVAHSQGRPPHVRPTCVRSTVGGAGPVCMHPPRCSIPPPLRTRARAHKVAPRRCGCATHPAAHTTSSPLTRPTPS